MRLGDMSLGLWLLPLFAVTGAFAVPVHMSRGLQGLAQPQALSSSLRRGAAAAGSVGGCTAVLAAVHAGSWWLLPAFTVWAVTLIAAALCDAVTQRVPTGLVRRGGLGTAILVVVAAIGGRDYRGLLLAAAACLSAGAILLLCWRFTGLGFGDVRLGILGGLGLGHTTHRGIAIAVATFAVITVVQALVVIARGGARHSTFPYGPALAIGFLLAAAS